MVVLQGCNVDELCAVTRPPEIPGRGVSGLRRAGRHSLLPNQPGSNGFTLQARSHFVEQPIHTTSTSRAMACPPRVLTRIPLVKCSPASLRCSDHVEVRPLCQERVASAAGVGDVSISRDSFRCQTRWTPRHLPTGWCSPFWALWLSRNAV